MWVMARGFYNRRMIIQSILIAALALPASAALTGSAEGRRNLLNILPRKDAQGVPTVADPADKLAAAQAALSGGLVKKAEDLYRSFIKECDKDAACDPYLDRARLGLGRALATLSHTLDKEDVSVAKESLYWLESVRTQALREEGQAQRYDMRVILANENLSRARFDANNGAWNDAAARVENVGADFPDVNSDAQARKQLSALRDLGRAQAGGAHTADLAAQLLARDSAPAPRRTRSAAVAAPTVEKIPALRSMPGAAIQGSAAFDGSHQGKTPVSVDFRMLGTQPSELSVSIGNWNIAAGQLGVGGRSPLLDESPYLNVRRVTRSPLDSKIDRRWEVQAGIVQLNSRFGVEQSPYADTIIAAARQAGVPEQILGQVNNYMPTAEDPTRSEVSFLAGTMIQLGRAMPLRLPFQSPVVANWAWSATAMAKSSWIAPNVAVNGTTGLNLVFPKGYQIGMFGGLTQEVQPIGRNIISAVVRDERLPIGMNMETSPQITILGAGPVPYVPRVYVEAGASMRTAATVNEAKLQTGIYSQVYGKPVQLTMSYNDLHGTSIDFSRRGVSAEASLTFKPGSAIYAVCEKEKIAFGGVDINNDGCLTGLRWAPVTGVTLTADYLFGGKDKVSDQSSQQAVALAATLSRLGAAGLDVADRIAAKQGPWEALNSAANPIAKMHQSEIIAVLDAIAQSPLSPQAKELIAGVLSYAPTGAAPGSPEEAQMNALIESRLGPIPDMQKEYAARRTYATEAIALLSNPRFWDGVTASAVDAQIAKAVSDIKFSLGPLGTMKLTNGQTILAGNFINSQGSPLSPITEQDATVLLDRLVMQRLAIELGVPGGNSLAMVNAGINIFRDGLAANIQTQLLAHPELYENRIEIANRTLAALPPDVAANLRAQLGSDLGLTNLDQAQIEAVLRGLPELVAREMRGQAALAAKALDESVALFAHQIRLRANRMILQHMLAGEEFDRLTVDRGLKLGDHGVRMIGDSLKLLDTRQRAALRAQRQAAIPVLEGKVDYHVDALTSASADQLAMEMEIRKSSVKISFEEKNRAKLVGAYGEEAMRTAINAIPAESKAKISIDYDPKAEYSTVVAGKDGKIQVTLPPPGRSPDTVLNGAITQALALARKLSKS
jgi:hypothetical protein